MYYHLKSSKALAGAFIVLSFFTAPLSLVAADIGLGGILKSENYAQTDATSRVLDQARFETFVEAEDGGALTSASLTLPGGGSLPLDGDSSFLNLEALFNSRLLMDQVFPNGIYTLNVNGVTDGPVSIMLNIDGDAYPNIPLFNNYEATQDIDPESDLTLSWTAFSSPGPNDILILEVEETGSGNLVFESDFLDPTTTSIQIPAGTFQEGFDYRAILIFVHATDFTETPATALGGYLRSTELALGLIGADIDPPILFQSSPDFSQEEVPVRSVVVFQFSEPMDTTIDPAGSIEWTNVDPFNFSYQWGPGGSNLYCISFPSLPTSTLIGWTLNPLAGSQDLRDEAMNPLAETVGDFTTADTDPGFVPDLVEYSVAKGLELRQTSSTNAVEEIGWFAAVFAEMSGLNTLFSMEVTPPGQSPLVIPNTSFSEDFYEDLVFPSEEALNAVFPDGNYGIQLSTARDGIQTATLLGISSSTSTTPRIINYDEAQQIDSTTPFTLQWDPFEGASTNDIVFVYIEDETGNGVFESPDLNEEGTLDGTSTSIGIPAGTLAPGVTYQAELEFVRLSDEDDTSYPGVIGRAGFSKLLNFNIQTLAGPPQISIAKVGNSMVLTIQGNPDTTYSIQAVSDLNAEVWPEIGSVTTAPDSQTASFVDMDALVGSPQKFYRVEEVTEL